MAYSVCRVLQCDSFLKVTLETAREARDNQ